MREHLKLFVAEHPARAPLSLRAADELRETFSAFRLASAMRLHPVALSLLLVLGAGVGTSYAAEGAVPHDALYPIKIRVNEQVRGALALTSQAKADWNAKRVGRRLEETETLAANDRLTADTGTEIRSALQESTEDFNVSVAALATEDNDSETVVDTQSNLEATLNAHAHVLAALAEAKPAAEEHIRPILALVKARAKGAERSRAKAEAAVAEKSSDALRAAAIAKKRDAKDGVESIRALAAEVLSTLGSSTSKDANTSAFQAEAAIGAGARHLERGDYGKAFNTFEAAIRATQEAEVTVDARMRLRDHLDISAIAVGMVATSSNSGKSGSDDGEEGK